MQTLKEVEAYIETLIPRSQSFGDRLAHVASLLDKLGNPQNLIPAIHIAGTSGKGSTAYYAAAMLHEAGYTTGLMVSPHVSKVSERTQINGMPLPDEVFAEYITEFKEIINNLGETTTYIEFLTCFAFWLFAKTNVDYIVIEVGLGGRLDATNTITRHNTVRVITDIGFDHTEILGTTLDAIAREKAGIIHDGDTVCMHPQGRLVMKSVNEAVAAHNAHLYLVERDDNAPAGYQGRNWALARQAVIERLRLDDKPQPDTTLYKQVLHLPIPGRFEVFNNVAETIVLDGAHNPQKMTAFMETLCTTYKNLPIIAVVSLGKNKQATAEETMRIISETADEVVVTEFQLDSIGMFGALPASKLASSIQNVSVVICSDPLEALAYARTKAISTQAVVVVTGSFYLISNVRDVLVAEFSRVPLTI